MPSPEHIKQVLQDYVDAMEFDEDGKVISMGAYWGESTARAL